ncbi:unnamed protein product [Allacma fusca]|uniref:Uncharacterized protein n=1 Tax=Allacma fusca TaxID=39272 RepID=A0A8J2KM43_9HEXA|nr:unnamed protein product [Allacma fusca]
MSQRPVLNLSGVRPYAVILRFLKCLQVPDHRQFQNQIIVPKGSALIKCQNGSQRCRCCEADQAYDGFHRTRSQRKGRRNRC